MRPIGAKIVKMILLGRVVYTVAGDIVKNFQAIKNAAASVFEAFKDFASGNFSEAWDKIRKSATGFDLSDSKKALDDLEQIVELLEEGKMSLEESLELYERGMKLAGLCQSRLESAEKRIECLTGELPPDLI